MTDEKMEARYGYRTVPGVCIAGDNPHFDLDGDGLIEPLDPDDDGDGIPTKVELAWEQQFPNLDGDFIPMWRDLDSDHDGVQDRFEGVDFNHDGIPAFADPNDSPEPCRTDVVPSGCPPAFSCAPEDSDPRYGFCESTGGTTTTTITGATTTTTTTLPTGDVEVCGNCLDDDGNGLTDLDDPACCAARATVTLKRGRFATAKTSGTKLTVKGLVPRTKLVGTAPLPDVLVQIGREGEPPLLCARIPGANQTVKKTRLRFKDKTHAVASARGINVLKVVDTRKGTAKLSFKGKAVAMSAPAAGALRVTVALGDPANRCVVADGSYRAAKKGIRFP